MIISLGILNKTIVINNCKFKHSYGKRKDFALEHMLLNPNIKEFHLNNSNLGNSYGLFEKLSKLNKLEILEFRNNNCNYINLEIFEQLLQSTNLKLIDVSENSFINYNQLHLNLRNSDIKNYKITSDSGNIIEYNEKPLFINEKPSFFL